MMNDKYVRLYLRKLFLVSLDLIEKNKFDRLFIKVVRIFLEEIGNDFGDDFSFYNQEDFSKVNSDDMVLKEFEFYFLEDILKKIDNFSFVVKEFFRLIKEEERVDRKWFGVRKEKFFVLYQGGFQEYVILFIKDIRYKGVSGEENIEVKVDLYVRNDLEE